MLTVGLLAGAILIGLALARAGRFVRYVPAPVVEGFTVGIAAVIFLQQVPAALGVPAAHGEKVTAVAWQALVDFVRAPRWPAAALALAVVVTMLAGARWRRTWPFSLIAVGAATIVTQAAHLEVARIGSLPATLPAPSLALAEHIVAYRFDGPLFFAAAHRFLLELSAVGDFRVVILRMSRVSTIDGSGALVLRDAIQRLEHRGITVYLSGVPDRHAKALDALAVLNRLREQGRVFGNTREAIAAARNLLHHAGILPGKTVDRWPPRRAAHSSEEARDDR